MEEENAKQAKELTQLTKENDALKRDLATEQEVNAEAIKSLQDALQNKSQELSAVALQCQKNIGAFQTGVDKMKEEYEKKLCDVGQQVSDQLETIAELQETKVLLQQESQELHNAKKELQTKLKDMESSFVAQEQQLQATEEEKTSTDKLQQQFAEAVAAQQHEMEENALNHTLELEAVKQQHEMDIKVVHDKMKSAKQESKDLQHQLHKTTKKLSNSREECKDIQAQVIQCQKEQQKLLKEVETLRQQCETSVANEASWVKKYHALETKHCKYVSDMEKLLAGQMHTARCMNQKVEEHSKELGKVQMAYAEVASERDCLLEKSSDLERDLQLTASRLMEEQANRHAQRGGGFTALKRFVNELTKDKVKDCGGSPSTASLASSCASTTSSFPSSKSSMYIPIRDSTYFSNPQTTPPSWNPSSSNTTASPTAPNAQTSKQRSTSSRVSTSWQHN
eukprot:TRINITY_DN21542_c0_g1_i1.p1 TRINITY_DN21542_c0_g1~~TRINITY_DN21542_c0_g1_i1.p1  ORF type:complete len:490 (-),score=110.47 TRINITY_DN21542_c0_g1_i1:78-1436(-)